MNAMMTRAIDAGVTQWVRQVTAWPTAYPSGNSASNPVAMLQDQVVNTIAAELGRLDIGERFRVVTVFGEGRITSDMYRTGPELGGFYNPLGAIVGLTPWAPHRDPWPPIGGDLVTRVVPVHGVNRQAIPFTSLTGLPFDEAINATMWTAMVEQLAASPLPIAVVVETERCGEPTPTEQMVHQGILRRAQSRADRRGGNLSAWSTAASPLGDFVVSIGIVGDLARFTSIWTAKTTLGLHAGADRRGLLAMSAHLVGALDAAKLIPVPVLAHDSPLSVARFRPRTSISVEEVDPTRSGIIALTDTGAPIGFDPTTINRHLLIVGDSGSGKSLTTMSLLRELWERFAVPYLVIDPLKFEHARMEVYPRQNPRESESRVRVRHLKLGEVPINPLVVPEGVNRLGYASAMAQALSAVTSLGTNFPLGEQFVRAAFNELYLSRPGTAAPTFADLEAAFMAATHQPMMTGEGARNMSTSLLGRLYSITSGVAGNVLGGGPNAGIDWAHLSQFPTVITFPLGISELDKAVIYALLVTSHSSWRLANPTEGRHVIALEEMHQVFGTNNPVAAQMLDTLLATMRASGQGYLGITQNPHQLSEMTQRAFSRIVVHRVSQHAGLVALDVLGSARPEVADLDAGEVLAVLDTPHGVRGRVPDRSGGASLQNSMIPEPSHRADEFVRSGPVMRGWCSSCPMPCTGRSWLRFTEPAAQAANAAFARGASLSTMAQVVVRAVQDQVDPGLVNHAGMYCAAARGITLALSVRGASDADARRACQQVGSIVKTIPSVGPPTT